jgi:hypothetical protein
MWEIPMWTRCCAAAFNRYSAKARLCDQNPLRVRLGMVTAMAVAIQFYVPERFRKQSGKWIPSPQRATIIRFPASEKKSA